MNKGTNYIIPIILGTTVMMNVFSQAGGYLSQKLMVENDIRSRVKDALSKVIDSHKYVINVDVDLEIMDEVNEQITVFAPRDSDKNEIAQPSPEEKTAQALVKIQEKMAKSDTYEEESYSVGLPIPGFEVDVVRPKSESMPLTESSPLSPKTMEPMDKPSTKKLEEDREVVDKVLSRKRPSRAVIKRMDLSLILQEGAAPELIENIRQLTMAASKFDRDRGDKLTIMTASFKERRDQRSAEQIMLKNIAEKIDQLEQKRYKESTNWREDIENYKNEVTLRREEDLKLFETQLEELDKKRLQEAAEFEKKELARKDSIRNSKLEVEIQALRDMLAVNELKEEEKSEELDSARFAMLDNELQSLRKMLLQAMLQDSIEAQRLAQAKIEQELAERESEKAERDSLIAEKIAALDAVQADLDALEKEAASGLDTTTIMLIAFGLIIIALVIIMILQRKGTANQPYPPPMPPYPPYPMPPRRKRRKKRVRKESKSTENYNSESSAEQKADSPLEANQKEEMAMDETSNESTISSPTQNTSREGDESNSTPGDDPNVLKSEIDDIRKSIVSMSVGQPKRTSTIVKEWLEQPAPESPVSGSTEPEATTEDASDDENDNK